MAFVTLQLRRDTAANWTAADPTLASGEMGIETDTNLFKIGDGVTEWTSLAYGGLQGAPGSAGAPGAPGADAAIGGSDTHVQFNDGGVFGGDAGLTFDKSTNALTIDDGTLNFNGSSSGTVTIQPAAAAGTYTLTLPENDGDSGQALLTDGAGVLSWGAVGGTPGGSDTQVQFNDGGVFGGDSGLTFNKTSKAITLGGATITTDSPVINATQTWNSGAVTFTGLKFNATDTASAAASLLMDLQVGGASRFKIDKSGVFHASTATAANPHDLNIGGTGRFGFYQGTGYVLTLGYNSSATGDSNSLLPVYSMQGSSRFILSSGIELCWAAGTSVVSSGDLILTRRAAANLRFGAADAAAPVAQTLSVQSVVAGTTNTAGANLTITGSQGTGTGAGGSIIFQVAPAGSSGTAQNALSTALTINSANAITVGANGTISFPTSAITAPSAPGIGAWVGTLGIFGSSGALAATVSGNNININSNYSLDWGGDTRLLRDAANTLAQRNGANAQAFRVYNTYTDATTFERANIFWDSNVLKIGTEKGSVGGTARNVELQFDSTTQITLKSGETIVGAGAQPLITLGHSAANTSARIGFNSGIQFVNSTLGGGAALRLSNGSLSDVGGIQFGGTTSSFPALKRSTTVLQTVLADDTGFATIQGKLRADVNAVAETPVATHTITITDAAGTAYKVLCVAA